MKLEIGKIYYDEFDKVFFVCKKIKKEGDYYKCGGWFFIPKHNEIIPRIYSINPLEISVRTIRREINKIELPNSDIPKIILHKIINRVFIEP